MRPRHIVRHDNLRLFPLRFPAFGHVIMCSMSTREKPTYDALVIGAGPSGATAAYWLASRGRRGLVVEKKRFPREKTCGDGLTPRAVRQLHDMGLAERLEGFQPFDRPPPIAPRIPLGRASPQHPAF